MLANPQDLKNRSGTVEMFAVAVDVLGHHRAACSRVGELGKRGFAKKTRPKTLSSKTISSKREDNFIHDIFIQKRVHPMTLSSKNGFVQ